jgi:two-component system sensor histidine kinase YesM
MILQPILENAIIHGLESKMGEGLLQLGARTAENGDIVLWIKDNGIGMERERLHAIAGKLSGEGEQSGPIRENGHLGIANVHDRLRTTYGSPYGIKITSTPGEGTEVIFLLPREEAAIDV